MEAIHRENTANRHHYVIDERSFVNLRPKLLYSGSLSKLPGWQGDTHSHEFLELIFVVEGEGKVFVRDREYALHSGDIAVYNAGVVHREVSSNDRPLEMFFIAFDHIELPMLRRNCILSDESEIIYPSDELYNVFRDHFKMIVSETSRKEEFYIEIAQNASRALLMYFFRLLNRSRNSMEVFRRGGVLSRVYKYIDENYLRNIGLSEIAEQCFVNKFYLSHLFTKSEGIPIGKYIMQKKINDSKRLLSETELPISEIADQCGFNDIGYFSRTFKQFTQSTPLQFRKSEKARKKQAP